MRMSFLGKNAVSVLSAFLWLLLLAGVFIGFDSRGAISDRNMKIGEPVPEGIIAVHDFSVPHTQAELAEMAADVREETPIHLRREDSVPSSVSREIEALLAGDTREDSLQADYFASRVRSLYENGVIDLDELRDTYGGSLAVVSGGQQESISEFLTLSEFRDAMRMDLQRRGVSEEVIALVLQQIVPDLIIDHASRDSMIERSIASLPRELRTFTTGQEILPPGGLFTTEISRYWDSMLESPSAQQGQFEHRAAKGGLTALLFMIAFLYIQYSRGSGAVRSFSDCMLVFSAWGVTVLLTVLLVKSGVNELSIFSFTMLGAGITSVFFDSRSKEYAVHYSWFLAGVFSTVFALYSPHPLTTFFIAFVPSCLVALLIRDLNDMATSLGLLAGVVSSVLVFWLLSTAGASGSREFTPLVWLFLIGVPLSVIGMVRVLVHPLEILFGKPTALTYQRLGSDSHPLREQLRLQAPGTHSHSMEIAEMAHDAAEAVGADGDIAKLGGIFHDIGKLANPGMFVENMVDADNTSPHIDMSPADSAAVIIAHVTDGLKLAKKYHLPREIRNIIHEHHGDSSVKVFLEKAEKELPPGAELDEDLYHYHNPIPGTDESAIIMLADSVSSAIRGFVQSKGDKATDELKAEMAARILREKEEAGQFDNCSLSPSDKRKIISVFLDVLNKKNYERVKNFPHGK